MIWDEEIKKKTVSSEQAANMVKSGDLVSIPMGREPTTILYSLAARKEELRGVRICHSNAQRDIGWYDAGWDDSFLILSTYVFPITHSLFAARRADYYETDIFQRAYFDVSDKENIDVLLLTVSPPDKHGYVSFGGSVWGKKAAIEKAKLVIAEINPFQIRTFGRNSAHLSEIDFFVEHQSLGTVPQTRDMTGRVIGGPGPAEKAIAGHVSTLIHDGDTVMIGIGGATEFLFDLGAFDGRQDLGIHTEIISPGMIKGVKKGTFTGARKNIHKDVAVGTAIGGGREEYDYVDQNPKFELYERDHILDPRVISAHDNMVTIASCFTMDLTGQGSAAGLGYTMLAGTGGQIPFAIGSFLSRGGRYILALTSTTSNGISRFVSAFPPGQVVTIPRWLTDYVVTEQGIANLRAKSQRQRVNEILSIVHPDHRADLKKAAEKAFWP